MEGWLTLRKQTQAFWTQSQADFTTALTLLDAGIYYASVFFSQQAAEKALKAVAIDKQQKSPKGHHLIQIANSLDAPIEVMNAAAELNIEFLRREIRMRAKAFLHNCTINALHIPIFVQQRSSLNGQRDQCNIRPTVISCHSLSCSCRYSSS